MKQSSLKRKPMKRSQPKRDWTAAREKVESEGYCRSCGRPADIYSLHAAHIVGREHDAPWPNPEAKTLYVQPLRIVPLCGFPYPSYGCHQRYDEHKLDILPKLTADEKRQALEDLDFDVFAYLHRTTGQRFVPEDPGSRLVDG